MGSHGVMFHHFHNNYHPHIQGSISAKEFHSILKFIGTQNILTPIEWIERSTSNSLKGSDICLTFDDALRCQFDVALPVMSDLGLTAFWFIYSSVFEGGRNLLKFIVILEMSASRMLKIFIVVL